MTELVSAENNSITESSFLFTHPAAWKLSTSSASISTICSILVIVFICRSGKLSSPYHKIMLFMSSWDVATSFAIALATIPMPSNVHEIYSFPGSSWAFGNVLTCTFQGFTIMVGSMYTVWSNCTLSIYYVCTIKYGMTEKTINRRVLPIMFGFSTLYVCILGGMGLYLDFYNPRPYEPFCLAGPYPHDCIDEDDVECIRGDMPRSKMMFFIITIFVTGIIILLCTLISMAMVIAAVFETELACREFCDVGTEMQQQQQQESTMRGQRSSSRNANFSHTRTALRQALMYIAVFVLTWVWLGISLISGGGEKTWAGIEPLKLFFQPLQGFFNAAIFFAAKVSILRRSNSTLTKWQAFRQVIVSPWTVPEMLVVSQIAAALGDDGDGSSSLYLHDEEGHLDTTNIQRTGRLRSGMPPVVVSVPSSNDSPSLNLSRVLSSMDLAIAAVISKGSGNADDVKDADADDHVAERNGGTDDPNPTQQGIVKNDAKAPQRITPPEETTRRRVYYHWPPPKSSSSAGSADSIMNIPSPQRSCDIENHTSKMMTSAYLNSHEASSYQEASSSSCSSVFCSMDINSVLHVQTTNLSVPVVGLSYSDDDDEDNEMHSRISELSSDQMKMSHGDISFA